MPITDCRPERMYRVRSGMAATVSMLPPISAESAMPKLMGSGGVGSGADDDAIATHGHDQHRAQESGRGWARRSAPVDRAHGSRRSS